MHTDKISLYLHIPFCKTMCTYCAFNTYTDSEGLIPRFVKALRQEIKIVGSTDKQRSLKTIYFGGGTPSLLTPEQYEMLFATIHDHFTLDPECEISLESNPNDLSYDYLRALRGVGFNRISIGMQSANDEVLTLFNRRHDTEMVVRAVDDARNAGFDDFSLDLIFASPHETIEQWRATLEKAIALQPTHLSHYELMLKGGTELTQKVDAGELPQADDDLAADMYDLATEMLGEAGYEQYEISNWSKRGYQSEHNLQYWRNLPYLGLGPGAHGYAGGKRTIVMRYPQKYIESLETVTDTAAYDFPNTPAISKLTPVSRDDERTETIMMGLRLTQEGISRKAYEARFGVDLVAEKQTEIDRFVGYGLLHVDDERVRVTQAGRLLNNAIIRDLI